MLSMDKIGEYVQKEVGESPQNISPCSWQTPEGGVIQGFIALTSTALCFVYESMAGNVEVETLMRANLSVAGAEMGVLGKTFVFVSENEYYKFGGMMINFERIIETEFTKAEPPPQQRDPQARGPRAPTLPQTPQQQFPAGAPQFPTDMRNFKPPETMTPYKPGSSSRRGPLMAAIIAIVLVSVLGFLAYSFFTGFVEGIKNKSGQTQQPGTAVSESVTTPSSSDIIMNDADGNTIIRITKKETGKYDIIAAGMAYKAKVEADRVKIKTATDKELVKVKVKDYGFKAVNPDETTIIKGKYSGAGYKVKTDTADLGKVDPQGEGYRVTDDAGKLICTIIAEGGAVKVKDRSGNLLYTIQGAFPKAVAFLPFLKDRIDAQTGVLIYFNEIREARPK